MSVALPPCPAHLTHRRGKRFVVVGAGKTGTAAAQLLQREGALVTVVDDKTGGITTDAIDAADVVVLSPGVPRSHPALANALSTKPIINELELGLAVLTNDGEDLAKVSLWGITGTNGKSTTATMAGAIAQQVDAGAFVGGNLGLPLCQAILDGLSIDGRPAGAGLAVGTVETPRPLVVELSSYQLETLSWFPMAAATVTNLTPDHLDRYPNIDAYYDAKAAIMRLARGVSLNASDSESTQRLLPLVGPPMKQASLYFDTSGNSAGIEIVDVTAPLCRFVVHGHGAERALSFSNERIVGHHNRQNAAAAAALALLAGVSDDAIVAGLTAYSGIEHRLESVGTHRGVTWWNDSKATNVDAAVIGVRSFASGVHLIAGGKGKGASYAPLVEASRGRVVRLYVIGDDAPALVSAFADSGVEIIDAHTLEAATMLASIHARPGEHIVLSPACASFDQFKDYQQRGEVFRACFAVVSSTVEP